MHCGMQTGITCVDKCVLQGKEVLTQQLVTTTQRLRLFGTFINFLTTINAWYAKPSGKISMLMVVRSL